MNPANVVLSAGHKIWSSFVCIPQQALHKYFISRLLSWTELLISSLGFDAELIGAAVLVMENFDKEKKA